MKRQLSDSSYKSANSQHSSDLSALVQNYSTFLTNYSIEQKYASRPEFWHIGAIQEWIEQNCLKLNKDSDGIQGLQLKLKSTPQKQRSPSTVSNSESNEQKFNNNYGKDQTALYMRGQFADSVEVSFLRM